MRADRSLEPMPQVRDALRPHWRGGACTAASGPSTAFMLLACGTPGEGASPAAAASAPLGESVMSHLSAALAYDQSRVTQGWAHFERRWAEGSALHRQLARSYEALGLHPRAAIRDEDDGQWHVVPVSLNLPLPPASEVVRELMRIYADVGTYNLLTPQARRLNRHASLVALASVTVVLEAAEIAPALLALLREQGWFDRALWTREKTPRSLGQLFEFLASAGFRRLLGRAVGARRAARCYAKMMARLVPGIGRRLLVADVLWLVFEQCKAPEVMPDGTGLGQLRPAHERIASRPLMAGHASRAPYNPGRGAFPLRNACASPAPLAGSLLHATGTP